MTSRPRRSRAPGSFLRPSSSRWSHITMIGATLLLLGSRPAAAQPANDTVHVVLTVSGGISRGSYQGGLNWGLVEIMRRSLFDSTLAVAVRAIDGTPRPFAITSAGGASAGNINGLLSGIDWCRAASQTDYEKSAFWQAWVWTGVEQLSRNADVVRPDEHGIFDRWFFRSVLLEAIRQDVAKKDFRPSCSLPVGITTTRLRRDPVMVDTGIVASIQRFAIPFRVEVRDRSLEFKPVSRRTYRDPTLGELIILTDSGGTYYPEELGLERLFQGVEASSAFPIAFGPRTLTYIKGARYSPGGACPRLANQRLQCDIPARAQFVDGGVFDNNPLGIAYGLHRCAREDARLRDSAGSAAVCADSGRPPTIVYMDPDARRNAAGQLIPERVATGAVPGFSAIPILLGQAFLSAREYELAVFHRTKNILPGARDLKVVPTDRFHAIVGDHFNAFGAFLGRPFREYDFYVGIYDAVRFVANRWWCVEGAQQADVEVSGKPECVMRATRALACGDLLRLDSIAQVMVAVLHREERGTDVACPGAVSGVSPSSRLAPDFGVSPSEPRRIVLEAVARGNTRIREGLKAGGPDPFDCVKKEFIGQMLCSNGFGLLLAELGRTDVVEALDRLKDHRACTGAWSDETRPWPEKYTSLSECRAHELVRNLVGNPIRAADSLFLAVVRRMQRVEDGMRLEPLFDIGEFAYRIGREPIVEWVFAPYSPSIPNRPGRTWNPIASLVPFHVSIGIPATQVIVGYRPTWYLRRRTALVFPVDIARGRYGIDPGGGAPKANRLTIGAGPAFIVGTTILGSVQVVPFGSGELDDFPRFGNKNLGIEVTGQWLANRTRFGVRLLPRVDRDQVWTKRLTLVAGVADLNGLTYWAARALK